MNSLGALASANGEVKSSAYCAVTQKQGGRRRDPEVRDERAVESFQQGRSDGEDENEGN